MMGSSAARCTGFSVDGEPFDSADEAWLWAIASMQTRLAGANVKPGMATVLRPCEASDVLASAHSVRRAGRLSADELQVMLLYGRYGTTPAALGPAHRTAVPYWQHAMDELSVVLEQKGIISSSPERVRYDH